MKHRNISAGQLCRSGRTQAGSAVIYSLIVIAVGAFVLAGWVHVLAARAQYTEQMSVALKRRMVLENSRLLASQYLLQNVLPGSYSGTIAGALPDGWAAFSLTTTTAGQPLSTTAIPAAVNAFSPGIGDGYTFNIQAVLSDGQSNFNWLFQARSRSPIFGFDLFTSQRSASQIIVETGLTVPEANVVLWQPNSPNSFSLTSSVSYQTPTVSLPSVSPLNGGLMSDFAFLPVTSGGDYMGTISVVDPGGSAPNSVVSKNNMTATPDQLVGTGTTSFPATSGTNPRLSANGAGTVTVLISDPAHEKIYIPGSTTTLVLQGQTSGADLAAANERPSLLIVVNDTTSSLSSIQLQGQNNRRLYLAVKKGIAGTVALSAAAGGWRLAGVFENTPLSLSVSGGPLNLTGGLRTNSSVYVAGGTAVNILRELDPKRLEQYADRYAWLEAFRQ